MMKNITLAFLSLTMGTAIYASCMSGEYRAAFNLGVNHGRNIINVFGGDIHCMNLHEFEEEIITAISQPTSTLFQACRQTGMMSAVTDILSQKSHFCGSEGKKEGHLTGVRGADEYCVLMKNQMRMRSYGITGPITFKVTFKTQCRISFRRRVEQQCPEFAPNGHLVGPEYKQILESNCNI